MIGDTLQLLRPAIRELRAYKSARSLGIQGKIFLDANESPWSPAGTSNLNRYPEPQSKRLLSALSSLYEVKPEQILMGRGADDAIDVIVRSFCEAGKDAILICPPTYGVYEVAANIQGAEVHRLPVTEGNGFTISAQSVIDAVAENPNTQIVFLCSPNNPTGNVMAAETVEEIARSLDGKCLVVLDEAYIEFASVPSFTSRLEAFPNVVVLRTLSKAFALAGARLGVAIGNAELIATLQKVRAPYPISAPAETVVMGSLSEKGIANTQARIARLKGERARMIAELEKCELIEKVFPTEANFVLVKATDSAELLRRTLAFGIVVRDRSAEAASCVRISVGSEEENSAFLSAVRGEPVPVEVPGRRASVTRTTKETAISATVNLDGTGEAKIHTGIAYYDHMLEQIAKHGGFDMTINVAGDLEVDEHHTVEDTAIVIGECLNQALGDRMGIGRYGFLLPMDESEAKVSLDLSGRPYLVFKGEFPREFVGELPTELVSHFFRSLSDSLRATLHVEVTGENAHHMVEACFKAVGRSLRQAIAKTGQGLPSTKGLL